MLELPSHQSEKNSFLRLSLTMRRAEFGDRLGQGVGGGGGGGKVGDGEMVGQGRVERERGGITKRHGEGGRGLVMRWLG